MALHHLLLLWGLLYPLGVTFGVPILDGMRHKCYAKLRDLNIAVLGSYSARYDGESQLKCTSQTANDMKHLYSVSVEYAIDQLNAKTNFLPNISLGFVILDYCGWPLNALADMLYLLPYSGEDTRASADNGTYVDTCGTGWTKSFDIIGVVGPGFSSAAVAIGGISTLFQIPVVLTSASSDELSDKTRFTYMMRLVPPDRFQAEAIIDLLIYFEWNYAALVYSEGPYGESGAKQVEKNAKIKGICLAFRHMIPADYSETDIIEIAYKMSLYRDARVIILFTEGSSISKKIPNYLEDGLRGHYIWIGSDYNGFPDTHDSHLGPHFDGMFKVNFKNSVNQKSRSYFQNVTIETHPDDPFLRDVYKMRFDCEWNNTLGNRSCYEYQNDLIQRYPSSGWETRDLDGLEVYFRALKPLIEENCPEAFIDKSHLKKCVTGPRLHEYMLKADFQGIGSHISFDSKGDLLGGYVFNQYHYGIGSEVIATWDKDRIPTMNIKTNLVRWKAGIPQPVPESVCSKPCKPSEYYILQELPCCWDCRSCRNNEILIGNKTGCALCELLSWPNEESLTTCIPIEAEQLNWGSPLVLSMLAVASIGLAICVLVGIIFIKNSQNKLIKASSRQLMAIILLGIMLAYLTVINLLLPPSNVSCYLSRFGFNLSVSLIYAPLMVKTSRVYRIFTAGRKGTKRPSLVGTRFQLLMVATCILLQLGLCVLSTILAPPLPLLRQQVPTEKYVETLCSLPLSGLIPPLSLNLIFIMVCAMYGFLTRKLPENFNESWYIFVSVATTTFLWMVFLPAYFTAFYASHQVALLACCLIFNGSVTLLCLYLPKVYCMYFVDADQVQFQTAGTVGTMSIAPSTQATQDK